MTKREGRKVLKRLKIMGIKVSELAQQWGKSRWTIYGILGGRGISRDIEMKLKKLGGLT